MAHGDKITHSLVFAATGANSIGHNPKALGIFAERCASRGYELGIVEFTVRKNGVTVRCELKSSLHLLEGIATDEEIDTARERIKRELVAMVVAAELHGENALAFLSGAKR